MRTTGLHLMILDLSVDGARVCLVALFDVGREIGHCKGATLEGEAPESTSKC